MAIRIPTKSWWETEQYTDSTIIPAAFKDKKLARYLVRLLETSLTRAVDKQDAEPLLDELRKFIGDDQA